MSVGRRGGSRAHTFRVLRVLRAEGHSLCIQVLPRVCVLLTCGKLFSVNAPPAPTRWGNGRGRRSFEKFSISSTTLSPRRWHTAADLGYSLMSQHAHAGKLVHVIITWMRLRVSTLITQALAHRCHPGLVMCAPARSRGQAGAHKLLLACFSGWENCETKTRESICGHVARFSVIQALAHRCHPGIFIGAPARSRGQG